MLKRVSLHHVGPVPQLDLVLSPRVNLITGDNGLGKSFLLDVAWWALSRTWAHYPVLPASNSKLKPHIRFAFDGSRGQEVAFESTFDFSTQNWILKAGRPAKTGMVLYAQVDGSFSVWDPARNYWRDASSRGVSAPDRPAAYLFAPEQVWDGISRRTDIEKSREEWLCNGLIRDWASWQKERGPTFDQLCHVLKQLSPSEKEPLVPGELTRVSLDDSRDMPTIHMPYGMDVAIVHASAAMRRIIALAYLLVWAWQEHQRASQLIHQPSTRSIVFLIDEIEAHLHPAWQRRILRALLDVMRALSDSDNVSVQILAITHSPMLLASMEPVFDTDRDSLWMFDLDNGTPPKVRLTKDHWRRRGDATAWLRSEVFDLGEARSEEAERAMHDAAELMRDEAPQHEQFNQIYTALRKSLPGTDPFWVTWRAWAWRHNLLQEATS